MLLWMLRWLVLLLPVMSSTWGCGYRIGQPARLPGAATSVHVAPPDVSRIADPALGVSLRRSLVFELRRRGVAIRGAREADLVLSARALALSAKEIFLEGDRPAADDLTLALEAVARRRRDGESVWRSGRVVTDRPRPWGRNMMEAEQRRQAALQALAADAALRLVEALLLYSAVHAPGATKHLREVLGSSYEHPRAGN